MTVIRVIDFETTGFEPTDSVIEYGYSDYDTDTKEISDPVNKLFRVDSVPPVSRAVHHIGMSDIPSDAQPFDFFADIQVPANDKSIRFFAAHKADFEKQWLSFPDDGGYHVICTLKCAYRAWPDAPAHNNGALRYWLEDNGKIAPDHEKTQPAHRAGPDAYTTAHILKAMFEAGITGKQMVEWSGLPALLPTCPIGEFRGKPWSEVDAGFLGWMVRQERMEEDYKYNARLEIERRQGVLGLAK